MRRDYKVTVVATMRDDKNKEHVVQIVAINIEEALKQARLFQLGVLTASSVSVARIVSIVEL